MTEQNGKQPEGLNVESIRRDMDRVLDTAEEPARAGIAPVADGRIAAINQTIQSIMIVTVRGIVASLPPDVPPVVILNAIALHCGNQLASAISADLGTHFAFRTGIKDAFAQGIKAAPTKPMPNMPGVGGAGLQPGR